MIQRSLIAQPRRSPSRLARRVAASVRKCWPGRQDHHGDRAARRGQRERHHRACRDGAGRKAARPDRRGGKPARRRRHDRRQHGGEGCARWLHHADLRRARQRACALSKLPYDSVNDFIPVISLGQQPLVIMGAPAKGYKTLGDLIAAGKAKPGALNYSTAGVGSASHFGAERLRASAASRRSTFRSRGWRDPSALALGHTKRLKTLASQRLLGHL